MKNSLSRKIFLGIASILMAVSLLMFGMLRLVMPMTYERELNAQFMRNMQQLATELGETPKSEWEHLLFIFAVENNVSMVSVIDENDPAYTLNVGITLYGDEESQWDDSMGFGFSFEHDGNMYSLISYATITTSAVADMARTFPQVFPYVLVMILLVSAFTAFFYARFLARPILNISHISKKMASLDMSWQCDTSRHDEIGILATNLNEMSAKLNDTLQKLQHANDQLQDDIEKERAHERRRRDFFAAISHELKTPITILKGELDGMILNVGKFKDRDKYLQEAYQTSESIEKLVREILTLAKLDQINLKLASVDLSSMVHTVSHTYENVAEEKQIQIDHTHEEGVIVWADQIRLQTVISNVMGNAIKHSPNGSTVKIDLTNQSLSIENSDVQIEDSELSKVWEAFYRTDKSRNRDTGGSGLGLYIVKTILDLHDFSYQIKNTEKGVKFTMAFPVM